MASIETLSTEVLDNVFYFFANWDFNIKPRLADYTTVSKRWRDHLEQRTFKDIHLKSSDLDYFSRIAVGSRRIAIRSIAYEVVLPEYSSNACAKFETIKQQKANDKIFSDAIHGLFRLLASWENESKYSATDPPRPITLELLTPASPSDGLTRMADIPLDSYELMGARNLHDKRYTHSSLRISKVETLPSVSRINKIIAEVYDPRKVCASHIVKLSSRLSNLEEIRWELCDDEKKYAQARQKRRREFSEALTSLTFQSLERFELYYSHDAPNNEDFFIITVESPPPSMDYLSSTLRDFSQFNNLTHLGLNGPIVIDSSLFWPSSSKSPKPFWPNLQTMSIRFSQCAPNGDWYFKRHPDATEMDDVTKSNEEAQLEYDTWESETNSDSNLSEDSTIYDDYHPVREAKTFGNMPYRKYRFYPDTETISPLLESMAKAAAQMPSLESFSLSCWSVHDKPYGTTPSLWSRHLHFHVKYSVTWCEGSCGHEVPVGRRISEPRGCSRRGRGGTRGAPPRQGKHHKLAWDAGDWRPEDELLDLWREVCPEHELNVEFRKPEWE